MFNRNSRCEPQKRQLRFETLEDRRVLAAVTVSTISDVFDVPANISIPELIAPGGAGLDGKISLREAIIAANNTPLTDTIDFAAGLDGATITLTLGELSITDSVTIDASMLSGGLTIDAAGNDPTPTQNNGDGSRIFYITGSIDEEIFIYVTLKGLTLTGGDVTGDGGAIRQYYSTDLTIEDCIITGNHATFDGGGIYATYSCAA